LSASTQGPLLSPVSTVKRRFSLRFCEELAEKEAEIRRLQRRLDRSRRANNPETYLPDGTVKKGSKQWKKTKTYLKTQAPLVELWRRLAAHRRSLIGKMVNETLRMGNVFKFEKLSYRALQRMFGKSVNTRAPGMFFRELACKAESAGGKVLEFPTRLKVKGTGTHIGLSSYCFCGEHRKKSLSERWHICSCGVRCQRDLFSAYLACFVEQIGQNDFELDAGTAARQWPGAKPLLQAASGRIPNPRVSSSSGQPPEGTEGVAAEERTAKTEARDVVALFPGGGESPGEVAVVPLRTPGFSPGEAQVRRHGHDLGVAPEQELRVVHLRADLPLRGRGWRLEPHVGEEPPVLVPPVDVELEPDAPSEQALPRVGGGPLPVGLLLDAQVRVAHLRTVDASHPHPLVAAV